MSPTITLSGPHGWQEEPEQLPQAPKNELRQVADTPQYLAQHLAQHLLHSSLLPHTTIHTIPEYPRLYFHLSPGGPRQMTFEGGPTAGEQAQRMGRRGRKQLGARDFLFSPSFYYSLLALPGSPEAVAFGRPGDPL